MSSRIEKITSILFTVAIVVIAAAFVYREVPRHGGPDDDPPVGPPTYVGNWKTGVSAATLVGDTSAPVVLMEFADLQCPACRKYQEVMHQMRDEFKHDVVLAFVHSPIRAHTFAIPAARAAECAKQAGKFKDFIDTVYANQKAIPHRSMWSYASAAGVSDSAKFGMCVQDTIPLDATIHTALAAGTALGVDATPTILVNGWRYEYPPDAKTLGRFIRSQLDSARARH